MKTKSPQEKGNFGIEMIFYSENEFLSHIFWNGLIMLQKVENKGGMWDFSRFRVTKWCLL